MLVALQLVFLLTSLSADVAFCLAAGSKKRGSGKTGGGGFGSTNVVTYIHTPDTSEETQQLLQFLNSQKSKGLQGVEIGYHDKTGIRGLFALEKVKKGKMICQIPSDCALALSDPSKNGEDAPTLAHNGANFLSMYWNDEQARKLWAPYLDLLPVQGSEQFDSTPDFFSDEELELLEFPRIINLAKERKENIATVSAEANLDVADLQFATWLVSSRAFSVSISAEGNDDETKFDDRGQIISKTNTKSIRVMLPLLDIVNHSSDSPNARLTIIDPEKDDAWFALEALRPIAAGKEITISYGNGVESSAGLLMNYGFIPQSNKIDQFMLAKGGDDCISSLDGWTTSLDEDQAMLSMAEDDDTLKKILDFRIKLKDSYKK